MMVSFDVLSNPIVLSDTEVNVLCIENKEYYRKVISSFLNGSLLEDNIVFSNNYEPIDSKNKIIFIDNYYKLDISSAFLKKIYEDMSVFCKNELGYETSELQKTIFLFAENLIQNYDYDFTFKEEFNLKEFFKYIGIKPNLSNDMLLDSLIEYILLIKKYTKVEVFVFLNIHLYFSVSELEVFFKELLYQHVNIMIIEGNTSFTKQITEKVTIIDNDLCEIVDF